MSFLRQRRSQPLPGIDAKDSTLKSRPVAISLNAPNEKTGLIRRVSSIFAKRRKPPCEKGIGNVATGPSCARYSSPSLSSSEEDIRRPSGLGPRSNSFSSNRSAPSPPCTTRPGEFRLIGDMQERSRCISSPDELLFYAKPTKCSEVKGVQNGSRPRSDHIVKPQIPPEILSVIWIYLPRHDIASLALVSKSFSIATRPSLYRTIDLRTIRKPAIRQLNALLASRQPRAELVSTFICHSWPPSRSSRIDPRTRGITPPTSMSKFAIALHNMRHLTSLTLPSFDGPLLNNTSFRLRSLTLLTPRMTSDEQSELFAWLAGIPDLTSLAFPKLVEPNTTTVDGPALNGSHTDRDSSSLPSTPYTSSHSSPDASPTSLAFPSLLLPTDFNSPTLLPALTSLHAPPTLTTLLTSTRSLERVTIAIHSTLFTGLRPSALMDALHGVPHVGMRFSESVDRRTVEKTIGTAGAILGGRKDTDDRRRMLLELDIEIGWLGDGAFDILYRIMNANLPRFTALNTLRLRRFSKPSSRSPSQTGSPASSYRLPLPTPPPLPSSRPSSMNLSPSPTASPLPSPRSPCRRSPRTSRILAPHDEHDGESEQALLEMWLKHCPTLRRVRFLSGTEYRVDVSQEGELSFTPDTS